jgi:hypothetical protein
MTEQMIEIYRKVWLGEGYILLRPYHDIPNCVELCTEPGVLSEGYFGKLCIAFSTPAALRTLASALNAAAAEMETPNA